MSDLNSPKVGNIWVKCQPHLDEFHYKASTFKAEISNTLEPFQSLHGSGDLRLHENKIQFCKGTQNIVFLQLNDKVTYQMIVDDETRQCFIQFNKYPKQSYVLVEYDSKDIIDEYLKQYIFKLDFYNYYSLQKPISQDQNVQITQVIRKSDGSTYISRNYQKNKVNIAKEKKLFFNEVKMLRILNHKLIIQGIDYFESDNTYKIVVQNYEGKNLSEKLKVTKSLTLQEVCLIIEQICQALKYLHSNNIIVRNLNLDSIQFKYNNSYNLLITCARDFQRIGDEFIPYDSEPNGFQAPEVAFSNNQKDISSKCDIYSCGSIFYRLVAGKSYQQSLTSQVEYLNQKQNFFSEEFKTIPIQVQKLIKQMLENNPDKRPSADEILIRLTNLLNEEERKLVCVQKEADIPKLKHQKGNSLQIDQISDDSPSPSTQSSNIQKLQSSVKAINRIFNVANRFNYSKSNSFNLSDSIDNPLNKSDYATQTPKSDSPSPYRTTHSQSFQIKQQQTSSTEKMNNSSIFKKIKNASFFLNVK
ncbi:hypothetical protein ABPG72_017334 [Tetrahymena utriculariae]